MWGMLEKGLFKFELLRGEIGNGEVVEKSVTGRPLIYVSLGGLAVLAGIQGKMASRWLYWIQNMIRIWGFVHIKMLVEGVWESVGSKENTGDDFQEKIPTFEERGKRKKDRKYEQRVEVTEAETELREISQDKSREKSGRRSLRRVTKGVCV